MLKNQKEMLKLLRKGLKTWLITSKRDFDQMVLLFSNIFQYFAVSFPYIYIIDGKRKIKLKKIVWWKIVENVCAQ